MRDKILNLIDEAQKLLGIMKFNTYDRNYAGRVASALITKSGNIYTGVSIDLVCCLGGCAEKFAIGDMIKHRETEIDVIVALYENNRIITPCGNCRELMYQIDKRNLNCKIIVNEYNIVTLGELLPLQWN